MRRRPKFWKKRAPPSVKNMLVLTTIVFTVLIIGAIILLNHGIKPTLMDVATVKTKDFATRGINEAVNYAENFQFDDVYDLTKNDSGNITSWNINSSVVNKINRVATDKVDEYFQRVNSGKVPNPDESDLDLDYGNTVKDKQTEDPTLIEIPIGQATGNTILANLGPKVPVNFQLVGNVRTDVKQQATAVGINTVLFKVYVHVEAQVQIIVPFSTDVANVSTDVYIVSGIVNFGVPEYYGGMGKGPSIAIPKDDFEKDLNIGG